MWTERPILWFDRLDSTNNRLKLLEAGGAEHGLVVAARQQTAGRGRMGRSFLSPEGNLYFSILLRTDHDPRELMHLTCWAATAACDAVQILTGIRPRIKWVNDLVYEGRKLGGILTELVLQGNRARAAIVGIGINCRNVPEGVADMATCLKDMTGRDIDPEELARALAHRLRLGDHTGMPLDAYRVDCLTLGKPVKCMDDGSTGIARDITPQGGLIIDLDDGTQRIVAAGEVSVRGLYGYL